MLRYAARIHSVIAGWFHDLCALPQNLSFVVLTQLFRRMQMQNICLLFLMIMQAIQQCHREAKPLSCHWPVLSARILLTLLQTWNYHLCSCFLPWVMVAKCSFQFQYTRSTTRCKIRTLWSSEDVTFAFCFFQTRQPIRSTLAATPNVQPITMPAIPPAESPEPAHRFQIYALPSLLRACSMTLGFSSAFTLNKLL